MTGTTPKPPKPRNASPYKAVVFVHATRFLGRTAGGFKLETNVGELVVTARNPLELMGIVFPAHLMLYPKTKKNGTIQSLQLGRRIGYRPNVQPGEFLIYGDFLKYDPSTQTAEVVVYQMKADAFTLRVQAPRETFSAITKVMPVLMHGTLENGALKLQSFKVAEKKKPLGNYPQLKIKKRFKKTMFIPEIDPAGVDKVRKRVSAV